ETGNHRAEAVTLQNMGAQRHELGRLSEAFGLLVRARALLRSTGDFPETEWQMDLLIARVQRDMGQNEEALSSYRMAARTLERLRAKAVPSETSRASVIAAHRDLFTETIDLLFTMRRGPEALEVAEAYHARAFSDLLAESRVDVRQDLTQLQCD